MNNLFRLDSPLIVLLNKVADLLLLNLLWIAGCIPVITAGASTVALYRCIHLLQTGTGGPIFKEFWFTFRREFKQSLPLFFIGVVAYGLLTVDFLILTYGSVQGATIWKIFLVVASFAAVPVVTYLLPLQSYFQNPVKQTVKNAVLLTLLHYPRSLLAAAINLLPLLLLIATPDLLFSGMILLLCFGRSLPAWLSRRIMQKVFVRYIPEVEVLESGIDLL